MARPKKTKTPEKPQAKTTEKIEQELIIKKIDLRSTLVSMAGLLLDGDHKRKAFAFVYKMNPDLIPSELFKAAYDLAQWISYGCPVKDSLESTFTPDVDGNMVTVSYLDPAYIVPDWIDQMNSDARYHNGHIIGTTKYCNTVFSELRSNK